jgi:hypothetical protein
MIEPVIHILNPLNNLQIARTSGAVFKNGTGRIGNYLI